MIWQHIAPFPVLWQIGPLSIRWYGLILVLAIVTAAIYAGRQLIAKKILSLKQIEDLFFYLIIFGVVGARLGHVVLFNFNYYLYHPLDIFRIWEGGISIQGALIGGGLALVWWCKKHKKNIWSIVDQIAPALALGQAIGRWGNYFNQELYGQPTTGWWGIWIDKFNRESGYESYSLYHPTFLYESILNLALFFTLRKLLQKSKYKPGIIFAIYLLGYCLIRFFMEFIRIDSTQMIGSFRLPQVISILAVFVAGWYIWQNKKRLKKA